MSESEFYSKRLNAKEVIFPKQGSFISNRRWTNQNSRRRWPGKLEKNSAWNLTKVKNKKEVIDEARTSGATIHFASFLDICHLKNAELETNHQKYAVFTEGDRWPRRWGPQGMSITGGGGLARVPNLRVCEPLDTFGWHTQGG